MSFTGTTLCWGYRSCDSTAITRTNAYGTIRCNALYSCFDSPILDGQYVSCLALMSCAYSTQEATASIACYGEKSCLNSVIDQDTASCVLYCLGSHSCMRSVIYLIREVHFEALYSGSHSIIYSTRNGDVYVEFYGAWSGYDTTLVCNTGDTCYVDCYGNNCNGLTLNANGGKINATCHYDAQISDACPNGKIVSSFMYQMPNLSNFSFSNSESGEYLCNNNSNTVQCDDYFECFNQSNIINTDGPICCSSSQACQQVSNIYLNGTSVTQNTNRLEIRCDGYYSCYDSTITAIYGADIYLTGEQACYYCIITTTVEFDILCTGEKRVSVCTNNTFTRLVLYWFSCL